MLTIILLYLCGFYCRFCIPVAFHVTCDEQVPDRFMPRQLGSPRAHDANVSEGKASAYVAQAFPADIIARGRDSNGVIFVAQPPQTTRVTIYRSR